MKKEHENYLWNFISSIIFILLVILLIAAAVEIRAFRVPGVFEFTILAIATFRLTHLLYADMVMDFVRDYFKNYERGLRLTLRKLLSCPWCIGMWMALVVAYLYYLVPYSIIFLTILALAGIGTFIELLSGSIARK